jgi:acyl transferase domain-containing protein/acyl carrier protein
MSNNPTSSANNGLDIAIIGMAGRFPGAANVDEFWRNLKSGVESISFFSDEELLAAGVDPAVFNAPNYVKAGGALEGIDLFDASFFGFTPREAEIMDPQQRLFLECAWEALESAGYDPEQYGGSIGVYAGAGMNGYLIESLVANPELMASVTPFQVMILAEKDFLTTRVSYKMNLKGPAVTVQTACSTSLVAIHQACQSLLSYQCDMSLAGGVSIYSSRKTGYLYQDGMILSPDGHCRAFDAKAQGTVPGAGVGIVVLKRLDDAIADGDYIYAVIKGTAVNNDGSLKIGYTAPSVDGQAEVIAMAQAVAGVAPETISYIETHGTGTSLGDPIEIAGLTKAFREVTDKRCFCAIGSVKTNIGHTDTAAGVAGVIKTAQALKHKLIPPSLHFSEANTKIDFANTPFYVNTALSEWQGQGIPRRAAVSSFGIGGTNAHAILEEAPPPEKSSSTRLAKIIVLSAKTGAALDAATKNFLEYLKEHSEVDLADVGYTLQVGRRPFNHRRILVCRDREDAIRGVEAADGKRIFSALCESGERPIAFMFPGQGAQHVDMGLDLYRSEAAFREQVDLCSNILTQHLGFDLRDVLYPNSECRESAAQQLNQTATTQPALFVIEYALAKLLMGWGIKPQAMIGHSVGEFVAACLAGVFSLEDALALVAARARLMNRLPAGSMLAVPLPKSETARLLGSELSLAAVNAPSLTVVSGSEGAIARLEEVLGKRGLEGRRLHTSHAFHSQMMEPVLEQFAEEVKKINRAAPKIPYLSNVTGTWITDAEAMDPNYWARHLRQTVHFAEGVGELLKDPARVLLEIGPGQTLTSLAKQQAGKSADHIMLSSMHHPRKAQSDDEFILNALGKLWLAGAKIDWRGFYGQERRHRLPLPTYPFERQRYWVEPKQTLVRNRTRPVSAGKKADIADWFYVPLWKQSVAAQNFDEAGEKLSWLVFVDNCGLGEGLVVRLREQGHSVAAVRAGKKFKTLGPNEYTINPQTRADYDALFQSLAAKPPQRIAHLWNVDRDARAGLELERLEPGERLGFYSLLFIAQAIGAQNITDPLEISVLTTNLQKVTEDDVVCPEKATITGPCKVIPLEYPNIACRSIDVVVPEPGGWQPQQIERLLQEIASPSSDSVIAYRQGRRWVQILEPMRLAKPDRTPSLLQDGGVYLITGGLGGIGLVLAEFLARTVKAKLVLTARTALPPRPMWNDWLATHAADNELSRKIRSVQKLEEQGGEVLVANADVANAGQMAAVIEQAKQRFGAIHGVIHAAGIGGGGIIAVKTPEAAAVVLSAKVRGTAVLHDLLKDLKLNFFVLCSSINAVAPAPAQIDYCAANAYQDAFAHGHHSENGTLFLSINWGAWGEVGMAVDASVPQAFKKAKEERLKKGIRSEEGVDAFCRAISGGMAQLIVSTEDFPAFFEASESIGPKTDKSQQSAPAPASQHSRPELKNAFVAPGSETEQALVKIWQELFGLEEVGVHDDFFELGGHSLMAMQVVSRIRSALEVNLPLNDLFEKPTVAGLAERIETIKWASRGIASNKTVGDRAEIEI